MGDTQKTRAQLIAEIEALRDELSATRAAANPVGRCDHLRPFPSPCRHGEGITRGVSATYPTLLLKRSTAVCPGEQAWAVVGMGAQNQ